MKPSSVVRLRQETPPSLVPKGEETCRIDVIAYIDRLRRGVADPKIEKLAQSSPNVKDILCVLDALGRLEPADLSHPNPDQYVVRPIKFVNVDPADIRTDAGANPDPVPRRVKVLSLCAPMDHVLVVKRVCIIPINLGAMRNGGIRYKSIIGAWKGICPELEGQTECQGINMVLENIILLPRQSLEVQLLNYSTCSRAAYWVQYDSWLAG